MENVTENLTHKKLNSWGSNLNDFKAEKELTVEITLNEYRELIESKALRDKDKEEANSIKYKLEKEKENNGLKLENNKLREELLEYKLKFGEIEVEKLEEE